MAASAISAFQGGGVELPTNTNGNGKAPEVEHAPPSTNEADQAVSNESCAGYSAPICHRTNDKGKQRLVDIPQLSIDTFQAVSNVGFAGIPSARTPVSSDARNYEPPIKMSPLQQDILYNVQEYGRDIQPPSTFLSASNSTIVQHQHRPDSIFSTDGHPEHHWLGSHYVRITRVRADEISVLQQLAHKPHNWDKNVLGKACYQGGDGYLTFFFCFQDIKHAQKAKEQVAGLSQTWTVEYIDHAQYAHFAETDGIACPSSAFAAQVLFEGTFDGNFADKDVPAVTKIVEQLAADFGEVLVLQNVSHIWNHNKKMAVFRVEYTTFNAAAEAVKTVQFDPKVHEQWTITARSFPPQKSEHAVAAGVTSMDLAPRQQPDGSFASSTGRTRWVEYPDGTRVLVSGGPLMAPQMQGSSSSMQLNQPLSPLPQAGVTDMAHSFAAMTLREDALARDSRRRRYGDPAAAMIKNSDPQSVDLGLIRRGSELRTTVMMRNIPNWMQYLDVKKILDKVNPLGYDFSYVRIDFQNGLNVGYAFVNFIDTAQLIKFCEQWVGQVWNPDDNGPKKPVYVTYATIQGIDCLTQKFRNSAILEEFEPFRPKLWYTKDTAPYPELIGQERPFPPPDSDVKKKRSHDEAGAVGLFPPRNNHRHADRGRRSHFDRGTIQQMQEEAQYSQFPHHENENVNNYVLAGQHVPLSPAYNGYDYPISPPMLPNNQRYPNMPVPYNIPHGTQGINQYQAQYQQLIHSGYGAPGAQFSPGGRVPHPSDFDGTNPGRAIFSRMRNLTGGQLGVRPRVSNSGNPDNVPRTFPAVTQQQMVVEGPGGVYPHQDENFGPSGAVGQPQHYSQQYQY